MKLQTFGVRGVARLKRSGKMSTKMPRSGGISVGGAVRGATIQVATPITPALPHAAPYRGERGVAIDARAATVE